MVRKWLIQVTQLCDTIFISGEHRTIWPNLQVENTTEGELAIYKIDPAQSWLATNENTVFDSKRDQNADCFESALLSARVCDRPTPWRGLFVTDEHCQFPFNVIVFSGKIILHVQRRCVGFSTIFPGEGLCLFFPSMERRYRVGGSAIRLWLCLSDYVNLDGVFQNMWARVLIGGLG